MPAIKHTLTKHKKKPEFDLKAFKKYVRTYKDSDGCGSADIFIKDMIYGIGLAVNEHEYRENKGYKRFLEYIKSKIL